MKIAIAAVLLGLAATAAYAQTTAATDPAPRHGRARIDANGDGQISQSEYVNRAMARFDRRDADHDGRLTKAEWSASAHFRDVLATGAAPEDAKRDKAFARADADGDGVITRVEAERAAKRQFAFLDTNADGALSATEMPQRGAGRLGRK